MLSEGVKGWGIVGKFGPKGEEVNENEENCPSMRFVVSLIMSDRMKTDEACEKIGLEGKGWDIVGKFGPKGEEVSENDENCPSMRFVVSVIMSDRMKTDEACEKIGLEGKGRDIVGKFGPMGEEISENDENCPSMRFVVSVIMSDRMKTDKACEKILVGTLDWKERDGTA